MPTAKGPDTDDGSTVGSDDDVANLDLCDDDDDEQEDGGDEEEEDEEEESDEDDRPSHNAVVWTGYGKKTPVIMFSADAIVTKHPDYKSIGEKFHLAFKIVKTECKLIRNIFSSHGFHEVHPNSNDYNMVWTGSHLKPYVLRGMLEYQKINHFPRSYEITRKDRLYKNVQRMQQTKGFRNFDFLPQSFIVPGEFQDFCSAFLKDKGPWIVKPIASSRGRGIFLVNHPEQVPLDETMIVSRYLDRPMVIDGFKFDIRLYVAVTSYDPLIIYLYEEGLTRFATVRYDKSNRNIRNQCMHLTNYSVNKKSNDYVPNDDPDIEDYGNKWSLGAMLRYLRSQGKDTTAIMMRIEDVLIKTILSAEMPIATACKMFMPFRGNCYELYGFDILIDENLRPWVLEVNLSPSLACDAPLDLKIKSNMVSDLFSLIGVTCQDPMVRKQQQSQRNKDVLARPPTRAQRGRPSSASSARSSRAAPQGGATGTATLTGEEIRIVRRAKEENQRRGGWVRIFPSHDSWELYGSYLQYSTTHNLMLYQQLFPDRARNISLKPTTAGYSSSLARTRSVHLHSATYPHLQVSAQAGTDESLKHAIQRNLQYERKLICLGQKRKRGKTKKAGSGAPNINTKFKGVLVQGVEENHKPVAAKSQKQQPQEKAAKPTQSQQQQQQQPQKQQQQSQKQPEQLEEPPTKPDKPRPSKPRDTDETRATGHSASARTRSAHHSSDLKASTEPQVRPKSEMGVGRRSQQEYNVVNLLKKGKTLSKVQARFAFASYLMRVQHRLMSESSGQEQDDIDAANEQMDLVLRFLKRAAGNLQQAFKVVVPSRKLALNDRRRILAKQLGDFVHIYGKETDQLKQRHLLEKKVMRRPPSFSQNDGLDEGRFNSFVHNAVESELEEVLTTYTKLNKSASIFLGSNSKTSGDARPPPVPSGLASQSDTCLARRKEAPETGPSEEHLEYPHSSGRPSSSSYAAAVSLYSTKLGGSTRSRPASASSSIRHAGPVSHHKSRPISASSGALSTSARPPPPPTAQRERPDGAESLGAAVEDENINAALQRLALRQQQRQYSATRSSMLIPADKQQMLPADKQHMIPADSHNFPQGADYDLESVKSRQSSTSWMSANETFNSFVERERYTDTELAAAYNQVTGVNPLNATNYRPTTGSTQYQVVQQRKISDTSPDDFEKRRHHQEMVAQAHSAQGYDHNSGGFGSLGLGDLGGKSAPLPPRPPQRPPGEKKERSQHRKARTMVADDPSGGNFYSSLKYDSSTGASRPVQNGYSNGGISLGTPGQG